MKKIQKIINENRVLLVLGIILLMCLIIVCVVALTYFYGTSDTVYGNRLDDMNKVVLSESLFTDIKDNLKTNESVKDVNITKKGKIIYINIDFVDKTKMDDAKKIAEGVVSLFKEEELTIYDIEFTISSLSTADVVGYTLMGARNANGIGEVVWNNYNLVDEEVE